VDDAEPARKRALPPWLVVVVVLVTGGFTVWAMSMTGFRGPSAAWDQAHEVVDGVWGEEHTPRHSQPALWGAQPGMGSNGKQVAALPGVPPIVGGVRSTHPDRGVCTNCHAVIAPQGGAIPSLNSLSASTHEFRGVCSNCHLFGIAGPTPAARLAAAPAAGAPAIKEAEWLGLEVAPSAEGVTVQGAEGLSARRGVLANDVIGSINAIPIASMSDFVRATQNGALAQGTLIVSRAGQRLAFELAPSTPPLPLAVPPAFGAAPSFPPAPAQEAQF
jgi:hypothetical protein